MRTGWRFLILRFCSICCLCYATGERREEEWMEGWILVKIETEMDIVDIEE